MAHVHLLFGRHGDGSPRQEPVHAVELGDGTFRLKFSPGFVLGVAAGDRFRLTDQDGTFEVVERGGNVAVQAFTDVPVRTFCEALDAEVERIGGRRDGQIERGLVYTIPVDIGFHTIESLFNGWDERHPEHGFTWDYGNVFDPDTGAPLMWWADS